MNKWLKVNMLIFGLGLVLNLIWLLLKPETGVIWAVGFFMGGLSVMLVYSFFVELLEIANNSYIKFLESILKWKDKFIHELFNKLEKKKK